MPSEVYRCQQPRRTRLGTGHALSGGYQPRELHQLRLPVAGFLEIGFRLRPLEDVWEQGQYRSVVLPGTRSVVTFYGPDLDTSRSQELERFRGDLGNLEATVSQVINAEVLSRLPLAGRDVYTFLITQPGVTADTTTARGLGLSAGGQRASAASHSSEPPHGGAGVQSSGNPEPLPSHAARRRSAGRREAPVARADFRRRLPRMA